MKRVLICVPCWNKIDLTRQLIDSIQRNSAGFAVRFLFLDNGSTDGTRSMLEALPNAEVIALPANVGVNPAWNALLQRARQIETDLVCLMNNDVIVGPDWLVPIFRELAARERAYYLPTSPALFDVPGETFDARAAHFAARNRGVSPGRAGWCFFFPPEALDLFLPIPEEMVLWYGDDWIHDKLWQHGYACLAVHDSVCHHQVSSSFQDYPDRQARIDQDYEAFARLMSRPRLPTRDELAVWSKARSEVDTRPVELVQMTNGAATTSCYNRFLYEVAQAFRPSVTVETGTDRGRSAAHLARGNPYGQVFTIDIDPACSAQAKALDLPNVIAWTGESLGLIERFADNSIDLLFLDSLHTYEHTKAEWEAFQTKLRPDALVLMDDTAYSEEMARFWAELPEPKLELNHLHFSGFGAWWRKA